MKERPILFSGEMVRAILDGRKTQTRRVIKLPYTVPEGWYPDRYNREPNWTFWGPRKSADSGKCMLPTFTCPQGEPGDRLWVRETFQPLLTGEISEHAADYRTGLGYRVNYPATDDLVEFYDVYKETDSQACRPSIFMPRWASRINLENQLVRVERVQDISEEDAKAEGCDPHVAGHGIVTPEEIAADPGFLNYASYREGFRILWDSINYLRGYGWHSNPWVFATTFKRITNA